MTFSFETTALQDRAIAAIVAKANADRAKFDPPLPPITAEEHVTARIGEILAHAVKHYSDGVRNNFLERFEKASPEKQAEVIATLDGQLPAKG